MSVPIEDTDADEDLLGILQHAREDIPCELDEEDDLNIETYLSAVLHFMRAGYLKAEQKYGSDDALANLFWNVADAVQPYAEHAEFIGQQFELTITDDGRAYCEEHYETEDEVSCDDCSAWFEPDGEEYLNPQGYTQCGTCRAKDEDE